MKRIFWLMLMLVFVGCGDASNQSTDNGDVTTANTSAEEPIAPPVENEVGIVFDYLKVFPYTIGTFEDVPNNVIEQLNKQEKFGYNTWRIPTQEELSLLAANGYAIDDNYMCSERPRGVVLLVTDDADASAVNDRRQQEAAATVAAAEKPRIEKSIADGLGRDGVYEVGYYYNRDGKQGVVFEVKNGGRNGKVISLDETRDDWDDARSWCRGKGDGWYLPSKGELLVVYSNKSLVNKTLVDKGKKLKSDWYWTSTEYNEFCAWDVSMGGGYTDVNNKLDDDSVRAVSAF